VDQRVKNIPKVVKYITIHKEFDTAQAMGLRNKLLLSKEI